MPESKCQGCGKPFRQVKQSYTVGTKPLATDVEIAPDVIVRVCGSERNNDYYADGGDYAPRVGCLRKAFEKAAVCPACGNERRYGRGAFSKACGTCLEKISRADKEGAPPKRYALNFHLISPSRYPSSARVFGDRTPSDVARELLQTVARVAAASGPRRGPDDLESCHGIDLPKSHYSPSAAAAVELDEHQRDAVVRLGELITEMADAMYMQGRKDGRDLLGRLASGDVSIREFEDRHEAWKDEES
jgi:hypothetical protein